MRAPWRRAVCVWWAWWPQVRPCRARSSAKVALIEVDGVVRTVRVGAKVDGELRLLRVDARSASLGVDGRAPTQVLQMQSPTGARDRQSGTGRAVGHRAGR